MMTGQLARHERSMLSLLAAGLSTVLALAVWLTPDPSGMGTHQQLGLPPCTSISVLGLRCPACGMTTAWALMADGQVAEALGANLGGALLFVVALVSVPWLLWVIWTGSPKAKEQWGLFALSGSLASMLIAFVLWAWHFASGSILSGSIFSEALGR